MAKPLFDWLQDRSASVFLHPTSLPGPHGIGSLGSRAVAFVRFLQSAGMRYWQVCPVGPTGFGDSPYQLFSSFAGNPYLIDLEALLEAGLIEPTDLSALADLPDDHADYGAQFRVRRPILTQAAEAFIGRGGSALPELPYGDFGAFRKRHAEWLEPFCLFLALKERFEGKPWLEWDAKLRSYDSARGQPLARSADIRQRMDVHAVIQYLFFGQWQQIRDFAAASGIGIIGDIPIFVALDSADVWARPELFQLDSRNRPLALSGVPPDYFSRTGQLWGNPHYNWEVHRNEKYAWWLKRLGHGLELYDALRIDHFRGFAAYWRIPYGAKDGREGKWEPGPGLDLFKAIRRKFKDARLIAEDLGLITDEVIDLLEGTGLPGMSVLHFAFDGNPRNFYLPHNQVKNNVLYVGTHDNDTSRGWYWSLPDGLKDYVRRYLRVDGGSISWDLIRCGYASVPRLFIMTMQDILGLGSEARLNSPGSPMGNWQWRMTEEQFAQGRQSAGYLRELADLYGRVGSDEPEA